MNRSCKIGVQLPEVERHVGWPELIAMAHAAEAAGFDSIWVGDHLIFDLPDDVRRGPWEAWTSLAALAAVTTRVELGPLVAATSFHAPAMLAKQAATVDAISGGRLIVGLGAGWSEREYRAFGFAYDNRVSRFEEAFTIIRTLLRDHHVDFAGDYYTVEDSQLDPPPVRPGGPPLLLGSASPRMLTIGLPHVDMWNVWWTIYGNTAAGFGALRATVDEAIVAAGREPGSVGATAAVLVQLDDGEGRVMAFSAAAKIPPVRGTALEIAEQLRGFGDVGATHLQLVVDPINRRSIEFLAEVLVLFDR